MSWPIGKPRSNETRKKIGEAQKGRVNSPEARLKMSLAKRGKSPSSANLRALAEAKKLQVGANAPGWRGGITIDRKGYVLKYSPDHPHTKSGIYVCLHRLIAEQALGRFLKRTEVVHHVNGIKSDNRNCNLVICQDERYHQLLHVRAKHQGIEAQESGHSRIGNSVDAWPPIIVDPFKAVL